ncbi:MAG: hypothetical protein M3405_15310 [Acidobacteriota bacterium]|nr:hypothetical protein [Acidobacteriota bacterium]
MYFSRLVFTSFILTIFLSTTAFAQISPTESQTVKDEAAEKLEQQAYKLLNEALGEAESLKLWENRALSFAIAGDLFWKKDQKRAKELFRHSADELIQGAIQPKVKSGDMFEEYNFWQQRSPRSVIMLMIAKNDADLALELLKKTRPAEVQTAIDAKNLPPNKNVKKTATEMLNERKNTFFVQQELNLEQQFAIKAAEQNPEKAATIIRESLEKGVSMSAINLIPKISEKNEDLGKELLGEVVNKLINHQFEGNPDSELYAAQYLLTQSARPQTFKIRNDKFKPIKVADSDLRAIAEKIADYYLKSTNYQTFFGFSQILPDLEKYAPSKVAALRQKEKEFDKIMPESTRGFQDAYKTLGDPDTTNETLISEAKKYPSWQKQQFYQTAVDKSIAAGEAEKVRGLLKREADSKQRDDALEYLDSKLTTKAIGDGKLEDAKILIGKSESVSSKIKMMVDLAIGFEKKNTEDAHQNAVRLMNDAGDLINQIPESREEVSDTLKAAAGLAIVSPDKAFPYLSNLINMSNDLLTAYALIAKYNKRNNDFRDGEIIFTQFTGVTFAGMGEALGKLAAADYSKTTSLIDQFQRSDIKTLAKLILVQSIINNEIGLEGNRPNNIIMNF